MFVLPSCVTGNELFGSGFKMCSQHLGLKAVVFECVCSPLAALVGALSPLPPCCRSPQPHSDTGCSSCANLIHFSPLVIPIIRLVCHVQRTLGSFAVVSWVSAQLLVASSKSGAEKGISGHNFGSEIIHTAQASLKDQ